jgi:hypothetical protein
MASDGMKDGSGGGAGSTYPFRQILATPRKTDADRGFRGDVLSQLNGYPSKHAGMLPTPTAARYGSQSYPEDPSRKRPSLETLIRLPTPTKPNGGRVNSPEVLATVRRPNGSKAQVSLEAYIAQAAKHETLPTPTKRDKRMDAWSPAYDKRKSPTMDAVLDGAMTDRSPDKWAYARQIAALLSDAGLTGPSQTLPITYGWMMGYPPGWLGRALLSAMAKGNLLPASSSRRSATPSSRKSPKP